MAFTLLLILPLLAMVVALPLRWRMVGLGAGLVFADVAVVSVAGVVVTAPWVMVAAFVARFVLDLPWRPANGRNLARMMVRLLPLLGLFVYNLVLVGYAPYLFDGIVETMPGSVQFKAANAIPLAQQPESLNQALYLAVCLVQLLVVAISLADRRHQMEELIMGFVYAAFLTAFVLVAWHFASFYAPIGFPGDALHTAAATQAWDQGVAGLRRPSGSFSEPSELAVFFIPFQFVFFEVYLARGRGRDALCWLAAMAALLVSTSTAAYVGVASFCAWMGLRAVISVVGLGVGGRVTVAGLWRGAGMIGLAVLAAMVTLALVVNVEVVNDLVQAQILGKRESSSFYERGYANFLAWEIFHQSHGIGIGLGNHRASSIILALLSCVGVIGTGLFLYFLTGTSLGCLRASGPGLSLRPVGLNWALATAVAAQFLAMAIASGELQSPMAWMWFAFALGVATGWQPQNRRLEARRLEGRRRRSSQYSGQV